MKDNFQAKELKKAKRAFKKIMKESTKRDREKTLKQLKEKRKAERLKRNTLNRFLTLDNAATIYPSIREENWDFVYRESVVLNKPVNKDILQRAVDEAKDRFPSFFVRIKSGVFWNYFESLDARLLVQEENFFPCARFLKGSNQHLIRVLNYKNRISVECFHAVADGRSTLKFLNSLVYRYLQLSGVKFSSENGVLNTQDLPREDELVDSFLEYGDDSKKLKHKEVKAYRIKGTPEEFGVVNSIIATMSVKNLKEISAKHNAKLFEFIIACLGFSIYKRANKSEKNRPIKISVPIDLRRFFESNTLRNFSGYLNVEIPIVKDLTFEKCLEIVHSEMSKIDKPRMQSFINSNVSMQKNKLIKIVPLFIKNFIIKLCFKAWGESYQTLAVSNLGLVQTPAEYETVVDHFEFNLGRPKYNAKSVGIVSYGDKMVLIMSSKIKENTTERDFLTLLSSFGVTIEVDSNREDLYE